MAIRSTATVIIDKHAVFRDGLAALIADYSYRVVGSYSSTEHIRHLSSFEDSKKLVILGAEAVDQALAMATHVHKIWPECKIVALFRRVGIDDLQKLLESPIDGFVSTLFSHRVLVWVFDSVMTEDGRIIVLPLAPSDGGKQSEVSDNSIDEPNNRHGRTNGEFRNGELHPGLPIPFDASIVPLQGGWSEDPDDDGLPVVVANSDVHNGSLPQPAQNVSRPKLSDREAQILEGLVCGYSNKKIAREFGLTEATVKVHMKSILRKIQVANRTQAAIWALENGFNSDPLGD